MDMEALRAWCASPGVRAVLADRDRGSAELMRSTMTRAEANAYLDERQASPRLRAHYASIACVDE